MVDWPSYNESLVRRGQVLLDFDVLDGWDHELSQMNLTSTALTIFPTFNKSLDGSVSYICDNIRISISSYI